MLIWQKQKFVQNPIIFKDARGVKKGTNHDILFQQLPTRLQTGSSISVSSSLSIQDRWN